MELTKTKYKKTEFGLIPEEWQIVKFKDCSFMKGRIGWQGLNEREFTNNPDEPYLITGMNFKNGAIRWNEVYHVSEERYQLAKEIQLTKGDVLMTKDGTIGKLLFVDDIPFPYKATLNSHLLVFRPLKKYYYPKYIYYNLSSPYFLNHIELTKSGTTFFGVSQESVGKYNLLLPPIEEQIKIATALSDVDELINNLEKLIAKKKAIKQGAMQQLLTPPHKGGKRLEGFSGEWVNKQLGELAIYKNGKAHENCVVEYGDYIIVNSKFISTDGNVAKYSNDFLCPVNANEILMVLSDVPNGKAIAKCFIVDKDNRYTLNQRICSLKPINTNHLFLYYLINRNPYFLSFDDGAKQTNLRNIDVLNCPLVIPPTIEEQDEIATIISDIEKEINQLEAKLNKSKDLKQGMMQELLTGKTRLL
jgi:type I restriction enzyme S subunit